jgi:hypothetical protein
VAARADPGWADRTYPLENISIPCLSCSAVENIAFFSHKEKNESERYLFFA